MNDQDRNFKLKQVFARAGLPVAVECEWCGGFLNDEEVLEPARGECGGIMCWECEFEKYMKDCGRCEEYYDTRYWEPAHFAVFEEIQGTRRTTVQPGYYRVLRQPIESGPIIGETYLEQGHIAWVANMEPDRDGFYDCEFLCQECSEFFATLEGISQ